jgi:putative ABC transport system substrate-binding protein
MFVPFLAAFRRGLGKAGFVEGQNVAIEFRWAGGQADRLPMLAADLVGRQVGVIAATGGTLSGLAAKAGTTTIPIVFIVGGDAVKQGLVASYDRPNGNATGVSAWATSSLEGKRFGLLRELIPTASVIGVLLNPHFPDSAALLEYVRATALAPGQTIYTLYASGRHEFDSVFATIDQQRVEALLVTDSPVFTNWRSHIIALAARHSVPTIYFSRTFAEAGGLMSYGPDFGDAYHQAGIYVGKILKGAKPTDLPVVQSSKVELVINLKTAKALRLEIPVQLLARANEVIE